MKNFNQWQHCNFKVGFDRSLIRRLMATWWVIFSYYRLSVTSIYIYMSLRMPMSVYRAPKLHIQRHGTQVWNLSHPHLKGFFFDIDWFDVVVRAQTHFIRLISTITRTAVRVTKAESQNFLRPFGFPVI